ncbi:hypothetical protein JCM11641_000079 [Rhodosporidiobolus odoratus]
MTSMAHQQAVQHPFSDAVVIPTAAVVFGFTSGLVSSSKLASKQFLAENAHRLPKTVQGWYFYQKTKNYRVLYAGLKGGLRTGARLGAWTGAFVLLSGWIDQGIRQAAVTYGGKADSEVREWKTKAVGGAMAGIGLAGASGWFYRLSRYTAPRRLSLGLALGSMAGGSVDLRDWVRKKLPREG